MEDVYATYVFDSYKDDLKKIDDIDGRSLLTDQAKLRQFLKPSNSDNRTAFLYQGEWVEFHDIREFMNILLKADFNAEHYLQGTLTRNELVDVIYSLQDEWERESAIWESEKVNELEYKNDDFESKFRKINYLVSEMAEPSTIDYYDDLKEFEENFEMIVEDAIHRDIRPNNDFLVYLYDNYNKLKTIPMRIVKRIQESFKRELGE